MLKNFIGDREQPICARGYRTPTLQQFEKRYLESFYEAGVRYRDKNLRQIFFRFNDSPEREKIVQRLRQYDLYANVFWPMAHLKSAGTCFIKDPDILKATEGTNWQKYLLPRF